MEVNNTSYKMSFQSLSVSKSLSQVCHVLSNCSEFVKSTEERCDVYLPFCNQILSEISTIVMRCQQQKQSNVDVIPECTVIQSSSPESVSDYSSSTSSGYQSNVGDLFVQEDQFVNKMTTALAKLAPNNMVDSKKYAKRKRKRVIPSIFSCLWRNAATIFSPPQSTSPPAPALKVDWLNVNKRSLANLPKPKLFPKHGCHQDPQFYESYEGTQPSIYCDSGVRHVTFPPKHQQDNPFGAEFGLETSMGVLCVQGLVLHGHIWSSEKEDWVIHATLQRDGGDRGRDRDARGRDRGRYKRQSRK